MNKSHLCFMLLIYIKKFVHVISLFKLSLVELQFLCRENLHLSVITIFERDVFNRNIEEKEYFLDHFYF